jgi:hypothetical protein
MKNIESQVIQRGAPKFVPPVAPFDFDAALDELRQKPMPFRLTPAQMKEIEDDRIGADTIAPYIAF